MTDEELLKRTLTLVERNTTTEFLIGFMSALILALAQKNKKESRTCLESAYARASTLAKPTTKV